MKLARTMLVDQTLLPNTRPARWNQTTSKMRPAAPDTKNANKTARAPRVQKMSLDADRSLVCGPVARGNVVWFRRQER